MGKGLFTGHPAPEEHIERVTGGLSEDGNWASGSCAPGPGVLVEQGTDEVFGLVCYIIKTLLVKLPLGSCNQGQGLCIAAALEWRLTTQSENQRKGTEAAVSLHQLLQPKSTRWH